LQHRLATRDQWLEERRSLLEDEKTLMKLRDALNQKRRALPWVSEIVFQKSWIHDDLVTPRPANERLGSANDWKEHTS